LQLAAIPAAHLSATKQNLQTLQTVSSQDTRAACGVQTWYQQATMGQQRVCPQDSSRGHAAARCHICRTAPICTPEPMVSKDARPIPRATQVAPFKASAADENTKRYLMHITVCTIYPYIDARVRAWKQRYEGAGAKPLHGKCKLTGRCRHPPPPPDNQSAVRRDLSSRSIPCMCVAPYARACMQR
jgi:hypothetical protein